jgi:hypothetical protein
MPVYTNVFQVEYINHGRLRHTTIDANSAPEAEAVVLATRPDAEVHEVRDVTGKDGLRPLIWDD